MFQLPPSLPDFTGREDELRRITERLRGAGKSVGISSALRGMGGVGKTVTAIEAAWVVKDDFPDGQLVVELRGMSEQPLTAVQAMSQLIRDFHPEAGKLPDDEKDLQAFYRRTLEGKKALVLLDDAKDESQVRPLLGVRSVAFVITSRNALALDAVESIRLGVLPPGEAFALLRGIVGDKGTDAELRDVAELCGRLPLALRVAGDFLRLHENWSLPKYTAALQDEGKRLEKLERKVGDRDVEAVLRLSASELVREKPQLAERWQMLSVFPADFDVSAVAAVWDLATGDEPDTDTTENELTALLARSLVQYEGGADRYSLHDLMRPIAREAFAYVEGHPSQTAAAARIATAEERFARCYCRVLATANELYLKGNDNVLRGLELFDREETNVRHGQRWAMQKRASNREAVELCCTLVNNGAHILYLRCSARERIVWLEAALAACRELGDRRGEGSTQGNLGVAWSNLGDNNKAIGHFEQCLVVTREIGNRRGEGGTLGNLGTAWKDLGNLSKARSLIGQALVIAQEIHDRQGEQRHLGNLGNVLRHQGEVTQAIRCYEQSLAISREIGDREAEGNALGSLGNAWLVLGDFDKAIDFYSRSQLIACDLHDRFGEGISLEGLSIAFDSSGHREKAIDSAERALTIYTEIESPNAEKVRRKLAEWRGSASP